VACARFENAVAVDRFDIIGALVGLVGIAVIMCATGH
jgi:drug/metabolite transporter superfamily protein YnfA